MMSSISDPWVSWIHEFSQPNHWLEAGQIQPPTHQKLRLEWAKAILLDEIPSSQFFSTLYRKINPLVDWMLFTIGNKKGKGMPHPGKSEGIFPFATLCQFALLQGLEGEKLGKSLLSLTSFSSLWTPESLFDEKEIEASVSLLRHSFGLSTSLSYKPDPYFVALAKIAPQWSSEAESISLGVDLYQGPGWVAATVLKGEGIPQGALQADAIQIRAFGPQTYPFNQPNAFGIQKKVEGSPWASLVAAPESWYESYFKNEKMICRFVGMKIDNPIYFSFYVKADRAQIGEEIFEPKQLKRYSGEVAQVIFEKNGTRLGIKNDSRTKMELIPLAGEGCFWNADFLLSFLIPPFEGKDAYSFLRY